MLATDELDAGATLEVQVKMVYDLYSNVLDLCWCIWRVDNIEHNYVECFEISFFVNSLFKLQYGTGTCIMVALHVFFVESVCT